MAAIADIIAFCDELLDAPSFSDWSPNGLQLPGATETDVVVTGVTARLSLFAEAAALGSGLVVVHHGILHDSGGAIDRRQAARLKALLDADIALAQYHLPLDAHPEIGNNALIATRLGAEITGSCCPIKGRDIGITARFAGGGIEADALVAAITALCDREPLAILDGPDRIETAAIISGAAADAIGLAADLGLDALITGEPREHAVPLASEAGVNLICAGHHATETFGIERLGDLVAESFAIEHRFFDIVNPV